MKKVVSTVIALIFCAGVGTGRVSAQSVEEIVSKANTVAYYQGNDGRSRVTMTITDSQGRQRKRAFTILRMDVVDGGEQKYYVYFQEPSDVQDMVYMVWKHLNRDDDRWLYLPALDLVRRIAATDKRSSFVGSNFVYEDISGRSLTLDTHELLGEEEGMYKIRNTPKTTGDLEFAYFDVYINKENFLPVKAQYCNDKGEVVKTIEALEIKEIQGHPTVVKSKASDLQAGSNTVIAFGDVTYDAGLDETIFTERFLRRPPRRWLD